MNTQVVSASPQSAFLKPFWTSVCGPAWLVSLAVFAVLAGMRFFAIFSPYSLQELYFVQAVGMGAVPFVILTASGRRQIGLSGRGVTLASLLLSASAGAACALSFFALGMMLYGSSPDNWCLSLRGYLHFEETRGLLSPIALFALYSLPAIFLNPICEEILFRGFIQESFTCRFNSLVATTVNSLLFALVYLSIHGIWSDQSGYHLRLGSAAAAVALMACVGTVFTICRTRSGSLWPAMAAHAAFNLTMLAAAIHVYLH